MATPVIQYDFENVTSTTIVNKGSEGSYNNATLSGTSAVITSDYATGTSCLSLTGGSTSSGGYLQINNLTMYMILGYQSANNTICFWLKKNPLTINETNARVLDFSNSTEYLRIYFDSGGCLNIDKNDSRGQFNRVLTGNICDGRWHHIALIYNSGNFTVYFDGLYYFNVSNVTRSSLYSNPYNNIYFGKSVNSSDYYATLYIDDFRIYKVSLSQSDITTLVSNFRTPLCNFYIGNPPSNLSFSF